MVQQKNSLLLSGIVLFLIIYLFFAMNSSHFDIYIIVLLLLGGVAIPFFVVKSHRDWFEPVYFYSIVYFVTFGLRTIYLFWYPAVEGRLLLDISKVIGTAAIYSFIGYISFLCGYYSNFARKICSRLPQLVTMGKNRIHTLIYLTYPIGIICRVLLIKHGWFLVHAAGMYSDQIPAYFGMIAYTQYISLFAFTVALLLLFSKKRETALLFYCWGFMIPFEIFWVMLIGSKHAFVPLLISPLAAWNYARGGIKTRCFLIPMLIFIFGVFPFVSAYRGATSHGDINVATFGQDLSAASNRTLDNIGYDLKSDFTGHTFGRFMERFNGIDTFSYVIMNTPYPVEFQEGRTILGALAIFVPRFIWPEKDALLAESMRLVPILFGGSYGLSHAGLGITLPAELYWNFRVPGLIVGMFLAGIFNQFIYLYFCKRENTIGTAIYISQLCYLFFVEGWIFHTYQNIIKQVIIFLVLAAIFNGGRILSWKEK